MPLLTKTPTSGERDDAGFVLRHRALLCLRSPRQRSVRPHLWLLLLSLLLSLTAACQSLRPTWPQWLPGPWGATPTPLPPPVTTQLHLATWSSSTAIDDYFHQRRLAYQQAQPDTQVELLLLPNYMTRLRTLLESDEPLDVVRINAFALPDLVKRELLAPLPTQLVMGTSLSPLLSAMTSVDATPYCVPQEINTLALFYNRAAFDAAQLAYPTTDWQWESLRTTAEQLTNAETGQYGLALPADFSRWLPFLYQAGGSVTASGQLTMTLHSPEALTALEFYTNLVLDGMAATPTTLGDRWAGDAFAQGDVAMVIEGNWLIPFLQADAPTVAYGVAPLPVGPQGKATLAFVNCYAIAAGTTDRAAAGRLIEFLTNTDSQQLWMLLTAALPIHGDLQAAWATAYSPQIALLDGLSHAYPWRFAPNLQPVVDQMNVGIQQIYGGFVLADSVLAEAAATGNERLQP